MRLPFLGLALLACCVAAAPASAQILRVADLNAAQVRPLDRTKTVVILPGGILEEHGPYLPAFTDGILSERLTQELARAVVSNKPGWKALIFPLIPLGSSGSNEIGGTFSFPGSRSPRLRSSTR